ncbi:MAG: hypothetical protein ACSNEK_10050 [Parachlamydiaceae bacterium]
MAKIIVGPFNKGLKNDVTPFNIDNDSFPTLINAFQWRGRVKRKRGTSLLGRLRSFFDSESVSYNPSSLSITLNGSGEGNLITGYGLTSNSTISPGSVTIVDTVNSITYTDPSMDGTLSPSGTINYATGDVIIADAANNLISAQFNYYPNLPVMGSRDLILQPTAFPGNISFNTRKAFNVLTAYPYPIYNISFYKNLPTGTYASYVQKTNWGPVSWNGQDYQQFWTVNYQGAFWATNGISVPFSITNVGMQYQPVDTTTWISATSMSFTVDNCPLVVGDFVYANEFIADGGAANSSSLNFQTGFVTAVTTGGIISTVTVTFPNAAIANDTYTGGILQYLTNSSDSTKDCIRWYDGDPTDGVVESPSFQPGRGWVNFCPPLSQFAFSIADLPAAQYYLVSARMIVSFKDRLLFLGPVVQTSASNSQVYLPDTIIYSQNGTPYYTCSFQGDPLSTTSNTSLLLPEKQTATPGAFWGDQTGFGGWISAGIDEAINTVGSNEDVLIVGFDRSNARLVYTGNDLIPFNFFTINSELGSGSAFSTINMDQGVVTRGSRGFIITSQTQSQRIDLDIPDEIFQMKITNNGSERVCAQRDFVNEWVYFTYPYKSINYRFPTQTLMYNYRDNSWAIFRESYTTYGLFRKQTGFTWQTVGQVYKSWSAWNDPWNAGESNLLQPDVVGGNQQGFLIIKDEGTSESISLYIKSIAGNVVTSPDHCLSNGDYILITGCLGDVGTQVNGKVFSVFQCTQNTFQLNPPISAGSYLGSGEITRYYRPFIQTKQFPVAWEMARKTRIGVQQYLFTTTQRSQIQLLIYLSQNANSAYNEGFIYPDNRTDNHSLIYSSILYTCPESTNLGLTPANINLQMVTAEQQAQTWHRMNTSLIGDTVQIGFTLSDEQMRDPTLVNQTAEIELHGFILDVQPSQLLA